MIGGFAIGSAAVASQPEYGTSCPGLVYGSDGTVMRVYGGDMADRDLVFGGVTSGPGAAFGGDTSAGSGIVVGGDTAAGRVFGGDERADC